MNIIIVGAGGFGQEIACLLPEFLKAQPGLQSATLKGFLGKHSDDANAHQTGSNHTAHTIGQPLLGDPETYQPEADDRFVLAIGAMPARRKVMQSITEKGGEFLTLVHPNAIVASTAELGHGVVIYPFAVVSNNARLSDGVKLNYYASVGHDALLGKYCLLAPYATVNGFAALQDEVYMSTHSTVAPQVVIEARSTISANSAAMNNVPADSLVFGVPGKIARRVMTP